MARSKVKRNHRKKQSNNNNHNGFKPRAEVVKAITYTDGITVNELADKLNRNSSDIIKILFMLGKMVTINTNLDDETVQLICMEYDVEATLEEIEDENSLEDEVADDPKDLVERPAIVTIMGHVDHGKTTLLDTLRKANVAEGEAGGITQHIGAYQVKVKDKKLTFLDTPGHEAFTSMRARGAQVTDIVIIVVAADDGVMPQTKEAIDHAKASGVPIIVAVNKMDKPNANPDRVMNEMADLDLTPEEWGGKTMFVKISALKGTGLDELLESILVIAEVEEFKANPNRQSTGTVIEAKLDKGRGPVTTLLVQNGTLKKGDPVVVGACFGRVRQMLDDKGREINEAKPSTPVEITGLNDVPIAGDPFRSFKNEKKARSIAESRLQDKTEADRRSNTNVSLDELSSAIAEGNLQEVKVIVKADVQGSAEALRQSLEKIDVETIRVNVIRSTVGGITESDVMLAAASGAIIIGFNVRPTAAVRKKAEEEGIEIRLHSIIYNVIDQIEKAMKGLLAPVYEEVILGQAEVRQTFKVSKIGTIAGCMVTDGKITRDAKVRILRDGTVIYTSEISSLKRFKNDAKEVAAGYDCGITIENFNDIKEGDVFEAFMDQEVEVE